MPETLPHLHFTTKQKSLFLFQHTLRVIVCVCVGVCIWVCIRTKGPSRCNSVWTATAAIQPTGERELSRKPVTGSQSILSDLYNKPFNGLTRPLEDIYFWKVQFMHKWNKGRNCKTSYPICNMPIGSCLCTISKNLRIITYLTMALVLDKQLSNNHCIRCIKRMHHYPRVNQKSEKQEDTRQGKS